MAIQVLINGAQGRMGQALIACAREFGDLAVGAIADAGDDFAVAVSPCDACIDFSHHSALRMVLDASVAAKKTLVLIGTADGASAAAKKRKIQLGTQNLSLAAGEFGVIKLKKLTKKQRKAIRKAQKSKLVVKTTLKSAGETVVFKKKYRLKLK